MPAPTHAVTAPPTQAAPTAAPQAAAPQTTSSPAQGAAKPSFDLDLTGDNAPLDATFAPDGSVLIVTKDALYTWDPTGQRRTRRDVLSSASTAVLVGERNARFSEDGTHVVFHAIDGDFEAASKFTRQKFGVVVLRTDTGAEVNAFTKVLKLEPPVEYAVVAHLSRTGRYILLEKPYQLEVFEVKTAKNVLRRLDVGFGPGTVSVDETRLLLDRGGTLELLDLSQMQPTVTQTKVDAYAFSDDQTRIALFTPKTPLRIWDLRAGGVTQLPVPTATCNPCLIEWRGTTLPTVKGAQRGDIEVFHDEDFSVVESYTTSLRPATVTLTLAGGKKIELTSVQARYRASHARLLVQGVGLSLVEKDGTVRQLAPPR